MKFSHIPDLSGPLSKPTEVNIKTLTSLKFESSCTGQWKIKTNCTVSGTTKCWAFTSLFMFGASVPSKLAASLVCKCKICFMFVHRVFNYARRQGERDAVGQQQIWDAPDPAVLPALLPCTLWGPGEHTELKVSFRLWIYIEWPDLFYQTGCRDWQKNGESHQSWAAGAEESRGAATPGPGVSGSEAKGTFDVTQSVLTCMFVSAVSTGNPGRLT